MIARLFLLWSLLGGQQDETQQFWMPFLERAQGLLLSQQPLPPSERDVLREELRTALAARPEETPWSGLASAHLALLSGMDVEAVAERLGKLDPWPYPPGASWHAAICLPPGPRRVRAVTAGLQKAVDLERWELQLAWNTAVEEARSLRLREGALAIQRDLHRRSQAEWSALDLALTLRQLNEEKACDEVLAEAIDQARGAGRPTAELWAQRGIHTLGFGDDSRARDYLGRALAMGSRDASLMLARLDLVSGRRGAARAGFRASILGTSPGAWAQRGWGLSLLPRPKADPVGVRAIFPSDD
jgi:hypothetical protein